MKILLSIKPIFAEKILNGHKKYEFRRALPKVSNVSAVLIYATMPVGKIVGEFYIDRFISDTPKNIWANTRKHAGISKSYFDEYFEGKELACAIAIKGVKRYADSEMLNISDILPHNSPPQSFCYVPPLNAK